MNRRTQNARNLANATQTFTREDGSTFFVRHSAHAGYGWCNDCAAGTMSEVAADDFATFEAARDAGYNHAFAYEAED